MTIAAEFAKTRYTLGVPISTLQGISHPLANIAITVQGGRNLARRAAWFLDNEPDERPELAPSAFVFMAEEAAKAATMAVHVQGGLGVSAEAAATAYLVRARGWAIAGGDPGATAKHIAESSPTREATELTQWISHGCELADDDQEFQDEVRRLPAVSWSPTRCSAATARPATTSTRACTWRSARPATWRREWKPGLGGRLQPRPAPDLGAGEAPRPRAVGDVGDHRDDRQVGGEVRFAGAQRRSAAAGLQRPRPAVPGLHRTRGRLRRRHLQDPRGARRRRAG